MHSQNKYPLAITKESFSPKPKSLTSEILGAQATAIAESEQHCRMRTLHLTNVSPLCTNKNHPS